MHRSITIIRHNQNILPLLLLFPIFKNMCLTTFSDEPNPPMKSVQIIVPKALIFHENTELLPSGDCYDFYLSNIDPTKHITLFLVGIHVRNKLGWVELVK